jgi:putative SOS response-associated peptidase YedK
MCGRYTQTADLNRLAVRFGFLKSKVDLRPRYNLAPGQKAPVVVFEGRNELKMWQWGLIPSWAKDASSSHRLINARAETLVQKPSFRRPFESQRCLIPADGFYEWRKLQGGQRKVPLRFVLKTLEPFAFAGLWDRWRTPEGRFLESFTIITTRANGLVLPIHDRMPVILRREQEALWLDPHVRDMGKLNSLLAPYPSEEMESYEVSPLVNSPANDVPECLWEIHFFQETAGGELARAVDRPLKDEPPAPHKKIGR